MLGHSSPNGATLGILRVAENTRCNFGPKSVVAHWKTDKYMICIAPFSDTVAKPITFSVGLNKQ